MMNSHSFEKREILSSAQNRASIRSAGLFFEAFKLQNAKLIFFKGNGGIVTVLIYECDMKHPEILELKGDEILSFFSNSRSIPSLRCKEALQYYEISQQNIQLIQLSLSFGLAPPSPHVWVLSDLADLKEKSQSFQSSPSSPLPLFSSPSSVAPGATRPKDEIKPKTSSFGSFSFPRLTLSSPSSSEVEMSSIEFRGSENDESPGPKLVVRCGDALWTSPSHSVVANDVSIRTAFCVAKCILNSFTGACLLGNLSAPIMISSSVPPLVGQNHGENLSFGVDVLKHSRLFSNHEIDPLTPSAFSSTSQESSRPPPLSSTSTLSSKFIMSSDWDTLETFLSLISCSLNHKISILNTYASYIRSAQANPKASSSPHHALHALQISKEKLKMSHPNRSSFIEGICGKGVLQLKAEWLAQYWPMSCLGNSVNWDWAEESAALQLLLNFMEK